MHPVLASTLIPLAAALWGCGDPCAEQVDATFLDAAAAAPGAVRTPSGLVFEELKAGLGPSPRPADKVFVRYTGMLTDSTVFDYTATYRSPRKVSLEKAIPGWVEGLQMMKNGVCAPPGLPKGRGVTGLACCCPALAPAQLGTRMPNELISSHDRRSIH